MDCGYKQNNHSLTNSQGKLWCVLNRVCNSQCSWMNDTLQGQESKKYNSVSRRDSLFLPAIPGAEGPILSKVCDPGGNAVMQWVSVWCKIDKASVYKETEIFIWWCWCLAGQFSDSCHLLSGWTRFRLFFLISLYIWAKI